MASHTKHAGKKVAHWSKIYFSFVERFWQLFRSSVCHISIDIGDWTNAGPFFGWSTVFQHAFVWDKFFVLNKFCRLLRISMHCAVARASPVSCRMRNGVLGVNWRKWVIHSIMPARIHNLFCCKPLRRKTFCNCRAMPIFLTLAVAAFHRMSIFDRMHLKMRPES